MSDNNKPTKLQSVLRFILGSAQNPFNPQAFHNLALVAFLAWVGLGADGLSSSCYGPQEAYLALGEHTALAVFVAMATALTVFIIALGYNQVVELFPNGGGGYKVATQLLGKYAGLVSGSALIVDYVLTIAVSIASGIDALFSLLPASYLPFKELTKILLVILLTLLNLRGLKESIKTLMPIFLGFVISHFALIFYGIFAHHQGLQNVAYSSIHDTHQLAQMLGWTTVVGLMLHSYSLGGGTYTGIEAVSNNVNRLSEPRARTGKLTMFYMAISLSFMASGIILLYLLWNATPVEGQTLNAIVFHNILGDSLIGHLTLILTLVLEAGILFVAANSGFLAGPVVLANMAIDSWVPNRFRHLSSRLVTQNGIIFFGLAALAIIIWSDGRVGLLVVLYSINVFLTFATTLLGLCVYWIKQRHNELSRWFGRFCFSLLGFIITSSILVVTLFIKFREGGWFTVVITSLVVITCILIKRHYTKIANDLAEFNQELTPPLGKKTSQWPELDPEKDTAVFFIGNQLSVGMHTLLWAMRMFPNHFKNYIFVSVGEVEIESFSGKQELKKMQRKVSQNLAYMVRFCHNHGLPAKSYSAYGTDTIDQLTRLAKQISADFPKAIFFASKLIFDRDNWIIRLLHNETPVALQRRIHAMGRQLIILPMKI